MRLYGIKISSYRELNQYKNGSKEIIKSTEFPVTKGDGIVLFNRENRVACVVEVTKVERSMIFFIHVKVLNPEDQDIPAEYFVRTGVDGLRFIGYSALCKLLKIN